MVTEVLAAFAGVPAGVVVDATCGSGGHSQALLAEHPDLAVLGLDRDPAAIERSTANLAGWGGRVELCQARSDQLAGELAQRGITNIAGFLMDLGVSSEQLDTPGRGFSFHQAGPLDMRLNPAEGPSAQDVVNSYSQEQLEQVLRQYGQERFAARIAAALVRRRPFADTAELSREIVAAIPARFRRTGGHPARRSFQAIRIEVNQELQVLADTIPQAVDCLASQGRGVFISYHSGEDTIVKQQLRWAVTGGCECPAKLPCRCGATPAIRLLHRGAKTPTTAEVDANPRARSAKLRSFEKLAGAEAGAATGADAGTATP